MLGYVCSLCGRFTYKDCLKEQQELECLSSQDNSDAITSTTTRKLASAHNDVTQMKSHPSGTIESQCSNTGGNCSRERVLGTGSSDADVMGSPGRRRAREEDAISEGDQTKIMNKKSSQIMHRVQDSRLWSSFPIASLSSLRHFLSRFDVRSRYNDAWRKCKFALAWRQLWFPLSDGTRSVVAVYSIGGQFVKDFELDSRVTCVRALAQCARVSLAMAAESGVFVMNVESAQLSLLHAASYSDLCFIDNKLFALNLTDRCVSRFEWRHPHWQLTSSIPLDSYPHGPMDSLVVSSREIFVMSWSGYSVFKFNHQGQHRGRFGRFGCEEPGTLDNALLCAHDVTGALLFCDKWNNRLQVLSPDGHWNVVTLMTSFSRPTHVVFDPEGDCVWLMSDGGVMTSFSCH